MNWAAWNSLVAKALTNRPSAMPSRALRIASTTSSTVDPELLTWLWHGLLLVAAVRRSISDDGEAMKAVAAAEVLERLLQPGR